MTTRKETVGKLIQNIDKYILFLLCYQQMQFLEPTIWTIKVILFLYNIQ